MTPKAFVFLIPFIVLVSCAKIEIADNGKQIVDQHQRIAIIAPDVYIKSCPDLNDEDCLKLNQLESKGLYQELFSQVVIKNKKEGLRLKILGMNDIETTLASDDYDLYEMDDLHRLSDSLNVDALLLSTFDMIHPSTVGESVTIAAASSLLLPGISTGPRTNILEGHLTLYDKNSNDEFWSYEHKESGHFFRSKRGVILGFMDKLADRLPYF